MNPMPPASCDPSPSQACPRQLDLFRDLPDGDMLHLLAVLEQEAVKAASRRHVREVIEELSTLRDGLAGSGVPALASSARPAERVADQARPRLISHG